MPARFHKICQTLLAIVSANELNEPYKMCAKRIDWIFEINKKKMKFMTDFCATLSLYRHDKNICCGSNEI